MPVPISFLKSDAGSSAYEPTPREILPPAQQLAHHHHHYYRPHSPLPPPHHHHHHAPPPPPPDVQYQPHAFTVPAVHPQFMYSKCTGRRRALCIGINYRGQSHELRGCVNDAKHIFSFLVRYAGYRPEDIVVLTDDSPHARAQPTRQNMIDAMHWLVKGAQQHDALFFHYSGHGGQTPDLDGDEVDGYDDVIFPLDYRHAGYALDDELHSIMVNPLPPGCRLTTIFDSCHSGTVLDLPYSYNHRGRIKGLKITPQALARKTTPADVISLSGCKDDQTSADTFIDGEAVGAASHAFIKAVEMRPNQSYQEIMHEIRIQISSLSCEAKLACIMHPGIPADKH
ncbi:caspase domain-containing protein [Mycena metata]|uniref:Caspase domain-containing protein n=1 Tax=Mycena metata TaxID=1033252 RepID=A0AAD7KGK9_9AGAR|nr:caspase domain-containing protein [Mycena metata]